MPRHREFAPRPISSQERASELFEPHAPKAEMILADDVTLDTSHAHTQDQQETGLTLARTDVALSETETETDIPDVTEFLEDDDEAPQTATGGEGAKPPTPLKTREAKREKFRLDLGAVDVTEGAEARAMDLAEAELTRESSQSTENWLKKMWKYNYGADIYRVRTFKRERMRILQEKNMFAAEDASKIAHHEMSEAIMERYLHGEDAMIHKQAGETVERGFGRTEEEKAIKGELEALVKQYAGNVKMTREEFTEAKDAIIKRALHENKTTGARGELFVDNILEAADRLRAHAAHADGLDHLDIELNLTLGKAMTGARTERERNGVEQAVEALNRKTGGYLSGVTNEVSVGIAYALAVGRLAGGNQKLAWLTGGSTAAVAAVLAGFREHHRLHKERSLHERQRATGEQLYDTSPTAEDTETRMADVQKQLGEVRFWQRGKKSELEEELKRLRGVEHLNERREEMERHLRDKMPAAELAQGMTDVLVREEGAGTLRLKDDSPESFAAALQLLAEADARVGLSNRHRADFLSYSDVTKVERERADLDLTRARLKAVLRERFQRGDISTASPELGDFDTRLDTSRNLREDAIYGEKSESQARDTAFKKLARNKALRRGVTTAAIAVTVGTLFQEGSSLVSNAIDAKTQSVGEYLNSRFFGGDSAGATEHNTALAVLAEKLFGTVERLHSEHLGSVELRLPDGLSGIEAADGTISLVDINGNHIADGLNYDQATGAFDAASVAKIEAAGGHLDTTWTSVQETTQAQRIMHHDDWARGHELADQAKRTLWANNDTFKFDLNELKLWWGGDNNIGIDTNGNYVFDMSHMTSGGSFHEGTQIDALKELGDKKIRLLLSATESAQGNPIVIEANEHGQFIIPKDVGDNMFKNVNDHAKFLGRFAEVAVDNGANAQGVHEYTILSTFEGKGLSGNMTVIDEVLTDKDVAVSKITFDRPTDAPVPFVMRGRDPMERMKRQSGSSKGSYEPKRVPSSPRGSGPDSSSAPSTKQTSLSEGPGTAIGELRESIGATETTGIAVAEREAENEAKLALEPTGEQATDIVPAVEQKTVQKNPEVEPKFEAKASSAKDIMDAYQDAKDKIQQALQTARMNRLPRNTLFFTHGPTNGSKEVANAYASMLGIEASASEQEIRKAYRQQVQRFHPDSNAGTTPEEQRLFTETYKALGEAYKELKALKEREEPTENKAAA